MMALITLCIPGLLIKNVRRKSALSVFNLTYIWATPLKHQARAPAPFHWMRVHTGLHARNSGCYVVTPLIFGIIIYNYPSLGTHAWVPLIGPLKFKGPDTLNPNGKAITIILRPQRPSGY